MTRRVVTVTEPTVEALGEREETDYRAFKVAFIDWLEPAKEQLSHRSSQTTLRYDQAPVDE